MLDLVGGLKPALSAKQIIWEDRAKGSKEVSHDFM